MDAAVVSAQAGVVVPMTLIALSVAATRMALVMRFGMVCMLFSLMDGKNKIESRAIARLVRGVAGEIGGRPVEAGLGFAARPSSPEVHLVGRGPEASR